ncbi:hypothetical protein AX16_006041 [Volvariella volvacea WC 439]|nr:hypothetical protein AX16_006041 [Volvariella volvacea WC 439]
MDQRRSLPHPLLLPDIVYHLSSFLTVYELRGLRSVSTQFDDIYAPYALQSIKTLAHLIVNPRLTNGNFQGYSTITRSFSKLQTCAKHLTFEISMHLIGSVKREEVAWKVKDLWMTVSKLSALESLIVAIRAPGMALEVCHQWLDCLFGSVVAATDGHLKELELDFCSLDIDCLPDLCKEIHGLRSLRVNYPLCSVCGYADSPNSNSCRLRSLESNIAGLISRNSDLETMSLLRCTDPLQDKCPTSSATGLFTSLTEGATGTPQAKDGAPSRPAGLCAPSFLHLHHLHLVCGRGDWDPLWVALLAVGAALGTLTACQPSPALIQFLCSFSGLKELTILHIASEDELTYPTLAHKFFVDALPNHGSTLKKLTLDAGGMRIPSDWTFNRTIWSNLTLPALTYLAITPRPKDTGSMLQTRYQDILDIIETHFPHVQDLRFCWHQSDNITFHGKFSEDLTEHAIKNLRSTTGNPPILHGQRLTFQWIELEGHLRSSRTWQFVRVNRVR